MIVSSLRLASKRSKYSALLASEARNMEEMYGKVTLAIFLFTSSLLDSSKRLAALAVERKKQTDLRQRVGNYKFAQTILDAVSQAVLATDEKPLFEFADVVQKFVEVCTLLVACQNPRVCSEP